MADSEERELIAVYNSLLSQTSKLQKKSENRRRSSKNMSVAKLNSIYCEETINMYKIADIDYSVEPQTEKDIQLVLFNYHYFEFPDTLINLEVKLPIVPRPKPLALKSNVSHSKHDYEEIKPFLEFCNKNKRLSQLFYGVPNFLHLYYARKKLCKKILNVLGTDRLKISVIEGGKNQIALFDEDAELIATMLWGIENDQTETFSALYEIQFSEKGQQLAQEVNMPPELIEMGTYNHWPPQKCLKRLAKMLIC